MCVHFKLVGLSLAETAIRLMRMMSEVVIHFARIVSKAILVVFWAYDLTIDSSIHLGRSPIPVM